MKKHFGLLSQYCIGVLFGWGLIKCQRIYELLEEVTDKCEDVANLVEGIVLENS